MEDYVDIEDVPDENFESVDKSSPMLLSALSPSAIMAFVESYGWFILIGAIVVYYLYVKTRERIFFEAPRRRSSNVTINDVERLRRMDEIRQRQQEAINTAAAKYIEVKKIKDEQKAAEKIEEWDRLKEGGSYRSKLASRTKQNDEPHAGDATQSDKKPKDKPKLRQNDFNPMTGSSAGSCSWRPSRRNMSSGGG